MNASLDRVGFATISERRALSASIHSPLERCTLIVTEKCNLRCVYCNKHSGDHMPLEQALRVIDAWAGHGLSTVMISGGEPTVYPDLPAVVSAFRRRGLASIILATNGTDRPDSYRRLMELGVTELSVSLDSGDRSRAATIHGTDIGVWDRVVETIRALSREARVVVGLILNEHNQDTIVDDLAFIDSLGPSDIKLTPSSHYSDLSRIADIARRIPAQLIERYTFLGYRMRRVLAGRPLKTLRRGDSRHCWLSMDDMAIAGRQHYPCYIYLRESGAPIGQVCDDMGAVREQRLAWIQSHDTHADPICSSHCVDFYIDYNNRIDRRLNGGGR